MKKVGDLSVRMVEAVEKGSHTVEEVHINLTNIPFEFLGKYKRLEGYASNLKIINQKTIGTAYDVFRSVNKQLGGFAAIMQEKKKKD